ncbi:hypothetical protein L6164_019836 [Bauhinia variegata]|uniref:Uncharacterized protein n=1 Tax=Bauhinia variegata TaxID=167791 RepID=A0ACB9MXU5_BAUVA|nr:hypothetical protein L6164_019836 [Bauhinia variegata]
MGTETPPSQSVASGYTTSCRDVKHVDSSIVHYLSWPIKDVDNDGSQPSQTIFLLQQKLSDFATCLSVLGTGVRFPGLPHSGLIGTAPSMELLNIWNERERDVKTNGLQSFKLCDVLHSRPLANLPLTKGCCLGKIQEGSPEWEKIAREAARAVPGRENGGNCDIKNLSRELKCEIIRGGMKEYLTLMGPTPLHVNPIFEIGLVEPRFSEWLVFEGISVDESGRQHFLDASVAYKWAVLNAIDYLSNFGYSEEQVYILLSACPCEGRISGIVDVPNAVATLAIPTAIFDQDIRPKKNKVPIGPRLVRKPDVFKWTYDGNLPTTRNPSASS